MNLRSTHKLSIFIMLIPFLIFSCVEKEEEVNNIILLIGDGMGVTQVYAAMTASESELNIERSQCFGFSKTYSATNLITDSGAGGTAIATGTKTKNYAIAVDTNDMPLKTILEYAADAGLSTGVVTTCNLAHATPASFIAHQPRRDSTADIALDFLNTKADVLIGGGEGIFKEVRVTDTLLKRGYDVTFNIDSLIGTTASKIACFYGHNHPPRILDGRGDFLTKGVGLALKKLSTNPKGFFLMVEGSQIDWAGHKNDIDYVVSETLDFDKAVGMAYDFADVNPGTLVIVTADHETGGLTLPAEYQVGDSIKAKFTTGGHTAVMVPIYTYGTGAEKFSHIMQNTDIFHKMKESLKLE